MRLDLRFRLAREQGQPARRGARCSPLRRVLLRGAVAAACVAGVQGATAQAVRDAEPLAPTAAQAPDLGDVPFFNAARTTWGGLLASSAAPLDVAYASHALNVSTGGAHDDPVARFGACVAYRVLCDTARGAVERGHASRFDYGLASALPATGAQPAIVQGPVDLASAEPFTLAQPDRGTRAGAIVGSLHASLARADLPAGAAAQIVRMLAGRIDPKQRGAHGDTFRVAFEPEHGATRAGRVRVTAFDIRFRGQRVAGVWFVPQVGSPGAYYDLDGMPLAGARFAMPVSATRISSRFGARVHPVSGARHVHSGVDLAAPAGRAVHASERGVVRFIGTEPRGYGKYVVIRHDGGYTSYYAHLSAFEPTLRTGARIARGQRVGAVGSTGTATGPHLHFEVRRHARLVDPIELVHAARAAKLKGAQRVAFNRVARDARTQLASAPFEQPVAMSAAAASPAG
ncbi:M23 family metallopeptidase [Burkholderia cenocepacia]|uniref:M23 family metallopeptidase n=1 Tax=Burkholderia cenocepacia TaxID=95486 RepID=UPI00196A6FF6|nr:M23 family metallopeptidase [Burkholderia cenocepacia]MBN3503031.1 M23 family metallopeptidase [Burkholderia cenocepacia]MCO1394464.1 M23 family metallopeptidase [Burkholderia cenocepacia]MCO1404720.1 M23 family metallopeptidase [Burkholderia cenocepacia]MCO8325490.1 M23 family metallopeptidase [Burkholderia cenocepacia]MCO8332560.1 M23 family metallopeptidase [Burkholderia cenocepacia]